MLHPVTKNRQGYSPQRHRATEEERVRCEMAKALEMMLEEFRQEAGTTRRVLERVPGDKLEWRPHAKARSLGELALHVARIPGRVSRMAELDEFDPSKRSGEPDSPKDVQEILTALEQSV